jgi:2-oxoglutarate ferredoxin oxidoreductase subunit alpha
MYPLPTQRLLQYAANAKAIYSVEQNATGQLARLIRMETGVRCERSLLKYDGRQLSVDEILTGLAAFGVGKEVPV